MKNLFLFLLLNISANAFASIEKHQYNILLFGDKIGDMTVTKETKPDGTELYIIESFSKAKILWITHSNFSHYETVYKNGQFISSTYKEIENEKLSRWGKVQWDGKKYSVENYAGKKSFTEIPEYTIVSLYFNDISKMKRVFYDSEADFIDVERKDKNTIAFKSSDGHRNEYHFVNGVLHDLEVHVTFATVKMERIN